jgi:hypothetical protein
MTGAMTGAMTGRTAATELAVPAEALPRARGR